MKIKWILRVEVEMEHLESEKKENQKQRKQKTASMQTKTPEFKQLPLPFAGKD
jgi:hypothetical protein